MAPSRVDRARRVAVIGWGNPGRGDDDLGRLFVERLAGMVPLHPHWPALHLVSVHQLQLEQALGLEACDLALFVDAAVDLNEWFSLNVVRPNVAAPWTGHAADPGWLLQVYRQAFRRTPPPSFLLRLRATSFRFAAPLSRIARQSLDRGLLFAGSLLEQPRPAVWRSRCDRRARRAA